MYNSPPFKFYIFLLVFNLVLWSLHYWVYRTLTRALSRSERFSSRRLKRVIAGVFIAFDLPWVFLYIYRMVRGELPNELGWMMMYPFSVWQAVLFFWVIVLVVAGIVRRSARWSAAIWRHMLASMGVKSATPAAPPATPPANAGRRAFLRVGSIGLTGYALASSAAGVIMRDDYEVNEREIIITGLPDAFKGYRIALISDIHSGQFIDKATMSKYADVVNAQRADLIVLPGDYVNSLDSEIYAFAEAFSTLRAPHGVYGVTGNHDHFANVEVICRESEQAGIVMLRNSHVMLERNGAKIALLGVEDDVVGRAEPKQFVQSGKSEAIETMMHGVPDDMRKILLCHRPYPFEEFAQTGVDVMLSGHTHGGQISLARFGSINLSMAALASKFVQGVYRSESRPGAHMYVTRGIGTVGLPLRINCPPEVTVIRLG